MYVKPTQLTAEQCLWDHLDKYIVIDSLENILKHIEKQIPITHTYIHKEQFKNTQMELMSDTQPQSMTTNPRDNISQMNMRVNSGQKDSVNSIHLIEMLKSLVRKVMLAPEPDMEK